MKSIKKVNLFAYIRKFYCVFVLDGGTALLAKILTKKKDSTHLNSSNIKIKHLWTFIRKYIYICTQGKLLHYLLVREKITTFWNFHTWVAIKGKLLVLRVYVGNHLLHYFDTFFRTYLIMFCLAIVSAY